MNSIKVTTTATGVAIVLLLVSLASPPANAGKLDRERLNQCKADLALVYGDARLKLKSVKRIRTNAHMRLQVIPKEGTPSYVTCWVDREGLTQAIDGDGLAVVIPATSEEQLSLN
ncbi:MAG: hypothetical protein AAGI11_09645 [Pseudomonadota bacterium]